MEGCIGPDLVMRNTSRAKRLPSTGIKFR